ncbi:hypothetical protein GCM10011331_07440 [Flavimobilis marinus]|uniref:TIGR02453 family protein n=1 Tax=Flavimobilis marinus TaxID=285351 RepID=A0A1I2CSR0_9MICO|nr:DUF2461 domain-containing protein [Flavimobilis marinus]GHG47000.1 hypothetical protein GCM10011331_07440 [Flavimobilis marinus]SFE71351.1 TIGR02453 family protein [Flavimobilis marinus]
MSTFQGLPPGLFEFFTELQADNSKAFWQANKDRHEHDVRTPMRSLLAELSDEFGPLRLFRPNRDMRFSTDKSPYKLWTGATSEAQAVGGIGYYLEISAKGVVTGYGAMLLAPDQLRRYRAAIDDERSGAEFEELIDVLAARSLPVSHGAEDPLKTAPRGCIGHRELQVRGQPASSASRSAVWATGQPSSVQSRTRRPSRKSPSSSAS